MNIVEEVVEAIAEIPGDPSSLEIARIAIEAYQAALWPPIDFSGRTLTVDHRRMRANALTAHIMHAIGKYLYRHGEVDGAREASRALFEMLYESGADIITDLDRSLAGLPVRDHSGLTRDELSIMEAKRIEAMLRPMPPMIVADGKITIT